ncbi:YlbF family regulator [Bacillus dakarensis]|uniref:YlbF family regulator n=1 Tax=Robertmurraya dakarensis TaxID=1926278 RepID=UPI000981F24E|nr:YlbF family regulator [Bacillus dakarensis]
MSSDLTEAAMYFEKVIRESNEYKNLQKVCKELKKDSQARQIYNQINQLSTQLQQKQMMGQEIKQKEIAALQNMESAAQQNERIKRLMEADYQLNMMMMELNKIISKPLEELYGQLVEK